MSSNVADTVCQDCGSQHDGISSEQLGGHTMCQACKDIALFKQPPQKEDCPICFLTLPSMITGSKYKSCCGKIICSGCIHAVRMMDGDTKCPFCRVLLPKSNEKIKEKIKKRVEMDDGNAIHSFGCYYHSGVLGVTQDRARALEFWHRAGELGNEESYYCIGNAYYFGRGVERDMEKAKHYWELAAMGGDADARYYLGILEGDEGNMNIALKHHMIAVACGHDLSLKKIREFFTNEHATRDDYAKALQLYQKYVVGIKSVQRDKAAAFNSETYRYY